MARHEEWSEKQLSDLLSEISNNQQITIGLLKKLALENPDKYPSYKTFMRKFGGLKKIKEKIKENKNGAENKKSTTENGNIQGNIETA
jgi:hypothetical protein